MACRISDITNPQIYSHWKNLTDRQEYGSIFITPEWQHTWWEQFREDSKELVLLLLGSEESPTGFAPLVREGNKLGFVGGTDLFDYHDFIFGDHDPAIFYKDLACCLKNQAWDRLELESIPEGSPTLTHLSSFLEEDGYSTSIEVEDVVPGIILPPTWEDYLLGLRKKDRHELRRKFRRLAADSPYQLVRSNPEFLENDLDQFLDLMSESKEEKRDFMIPDRGKFFRNMVNKAQSGGYLRMFFLELGGERVAGVICFDYSGHRLLYNSGYRLQYGRYSVGLLLKALVIEDAITEGLTYFDFLRGAEPYKFHLGGREKNLYRMVVSRG